MKTPRHAAFSASSHVPRAIREPVVRLEAEHDRVDSDRRDHGPR